MFPCFSLLFVDKLLFSCCLVSHLRPFLVSNSVSFPVSRSISRLFSPRFQKNWSCPPLVPSMAPVTLSLLPPVLLVPLDQGHPRLSIACVSSGTVTGCKDQFRLSLKEHRSLHLICALSEVLHACLLSSHAHLCGLVVLSFIKKHK